MSERLRSMMGDRWVLDWEEGAWILTEYREDQIAGKVLFPEDVRLALGAYLGIADKQVSLSQRLEVTEDAHARIVSGTISCPSCGAPFGWCGLSAVIAAREIRCGQCGTRWLTNLNVVCCLDREHT